MSIPRYHNDGVLEMPMDLKTSDLSQRSVLITGAGRGLGKAYSKAFAAAGAYVTVTDIDEALGGEVVQEIGASNAQFVKCDVTDWDQQVKAFEAAIQNSPSKSLDVVIANTGIGGRDDIFELDDPNEPPVKPNLKIMDVSLTGMLYTVKLAMHYFRRQPLDDQHDRCLILKSSLAGYMDVPGLVQYNTAKFGVRGLMRSLRRTSWREGIRINLVAPWYVRTPALPQSAQDYLEKKGVHFATTDDAARAMLWIASDRTINGRALGIVPKEQDENGVIDLGLDDFSEGSRYHEWQQTVLNTVEILTETH